MEHLISVKKPGERGLIIIFSRTTRVSAMIEINNDVYGPTPDIAESSPRGDPDLGRGCRSPPHAGEARRNPNCSAEAKIEEGETNTGDLRETREGSGQRCRVDVSTMISE